MSTEDTTAQLREQIAAAINRHEERWPPAEFPTWDLVAALMPIVLAQVEAAKATARREALGDAAYELLAEPDMNAHETASWLLARASAQGVAPPAEVIATAVIPANTIKVGDRINFKWSAGQGAQSSGHEYRDLAGDGQECIVRAEPKELCGKFRDDPIHQRAGQPGEQPAEPKNQWCAAPGHAGCTVNGAGVLHHHRPEERP